MKWSKTRASIPFQSPARRLSRPAATLPTPASIPARASLVWASQIKRLEGPGKYRCRLACYFRFCVSCPLFKKKYGDRYFVTSIRKESSIGVVLQIELRSEMVGSQSYVKRFMSSNSASLGISGEADCGFFLGQHNASNAGSRLKCVRWNVCGCAAQCGYFNKQVFFECADK